MSTVVISGAASGLGYALYKDIVSDNEVLRVIGIDRESIDMLSNIDDRKTQSEVHDVDVTSEESIENFAKGCLGEKTPVHLLIHSVGVRGLVSAEENRYPGDVARAETLDIMDKETMMRTYEINTVGTFQLIRALLPSLKRGSTSEKPAKVVIMGSRMGSMSYNTMGSAYAYRASKAALNAVVKSLSIDIPQVIFTIIHPGRVATNLVKTREEGAIEPEESVADMMKVIAALTSEDSGKFYDRFGDTIGW